jgi:ferrous iron transport protein A
VNNSIPLTSLAAGQIAEIERISGDPSQVHRLHELGMHQGTKLQMIRPGSPCVVRLAGHKLCFRQNNGLEVRVRPFEGG